MKWIFLVFSFVLIRSVTGQDLPQNSLLYLDEIRLDSVDEFKEQYDFTPLLFRNERVIGFIGSQYKRLGICLTSVEKDKKVEGIYQIKGVSKVGNNVCDFEGEIKVITTFFQNRKELEVLYEEARRHNDSEAMERLKRVRCSFVAEYCFDEDSNQRGSGSFRGILRTDFFLRNDGVGYEIDDYSDQNRNSQYVGIWKSYKTGLTKICNWGAYRIPDSGDLDVGVGEFSPNPKYFDYGWRSYRGAYLYGDKKSEQIENEEWGFCDEFIPR